MAIALNAMNANCPDGLRQVLFSKMIQSHILQNCYVGECELLAVLLCV